MCYPARIYVQATCAPADGAKRHFFKVKVLPSTPAGLSQTARRVLEELSWSGGMSRKKSWEPKPWGAEIGKVGGYFFHKDDGVWLRCFILLGHNRCNEFFSPCNLFGIFSGDISWGCFGRGGRLPKGFPQEPNAGGSSETSEVSQLEMFSLSPLQVVMFCCFFFGGWGWGDIFLVFKNQETLFCLVGSF